MREWSELSAALTRLVEAAAAAFAALPNEDTTAVHTQAQKALVTCATLQGVLAEREPALGVLHGLNNKLTGALSLTMLAREDVGRASPHDAALAAVEQRAREAADAARALATRLKAS